MTRSFAAVTTIPKLQLGLAARFGLIATIFLGEKTLLNALIDFHRALATLGLDTFAHVVHYQGMPFLVVFAAAIALFAYVRGGGRLKSVDAAVRLEKIRVTWMLAHASFAACLVPLSHLSYRYGVTEQAFAGIVALWVLLGLGAVASAFLAMAPWPRWVAVARALGVIWCYAAVVGLLSSGAILLSQKLWEPTASLTFDLVRLVLSPIFPSMYVDAANRELGTDHFAISITAACSGLEGIGLILAFTIVWLLCFRREYLFPRALLLIPLGIATIFALNAVRIAVLLLIGNAGYVDVASYGFHSQAGWIAFIAASCGVAIGSQRSTWLYRAPAESTATGSADNPAAAFLMPLVAILAAGVVSQAMSGRFESLYPLRLAAGAVVLWIYRQRLMTLDWHWTWRGAAVGVAVYLVWIVGAHYVLPAAAMPKQMASLSLATRWIWVASRVIASVVIVPIAEELAYRGYLMRRLSSQHFELFSFRLVRWPALIATSVLFGLGHSTLWLPGIVAGVAFGWILIRRGSIGEAVAAHVTSNALVAASVLAFGQWQLW